MTLPIHVEAPDEMGHQGSLPNKLEAIESLDNKVIRVVKEEMEKAGVDYACSDCGVHCNFCIHCNQ